jgi:DNA-binding NarL/FixJ family response regulator
LRLVGVRVFLCDDVPAFRALMRAVLEETDDCEVVGEAADGVAGVAGVRETRPDVVLLDLDMPGGDGLSAIPGIRRAVPDTRIVVLSSFDAARMERRALDAGADAYLEKRTPLPEVCALVCGG